MAAPQRRRQRSKEGAAPACRRLFDGQVAAHVEEICIRQDRMLAGPGAKYPKAVCRGPVTQMTLHAQRHRHGHHDAQHRVAVQVGHAARASPSNRGKILPPLDEARLVWRQRLQQKVGKSPRLIGANDDFTELSGCVRGRNDEKDKVRREFEKKCLNDWSESSPRPVKNDIALQTFKPLRDQLRRVNPHIDQILAVHQIEKSDAVPPKSTERLSNARIESQKPSCDFFRSEPDANEPLPHRSISPVLPIASEAPAQPHPTKAPAMAHSSPKPARGNVLDCGADADAGREGDIFATVKRLVEDGVKKLRGTGDSGRSSLYTNEKRWKNDAVFEALGTTDELSSQLGVAREKLSQLGLVDLCELLVKVQSVLQDVGSHLATPPATGSKAKVARTAFNAALVQEIDEQIDFYGDKSPPLRQFILPGGPRGSAELHVCRSVCRRLERRIAAIVRGCGTAEDDPTSSSNQSGLDLNVLKYVNRLSDLLFVMARYANTLSGQEEISYRKPFARKNV